MRRRLHRWALWLLPLLVARLFVPAGFMLSVSGEGLAIALCPGYAELPGRGGAHAMHGDSHASHGEHHSSHQSDGPSACPFLLAGSTAGCPCIKMNGEQPRFADAVLSGHHHPAWISRSVLIDRIRGPPLA